MRPRSPVTCSGSILSISLTWSLAKIAARGLLDARPEPTAPAFVENGVEVRVSDTALAASGTVEGVLDALWAQLPADGYVSIQAYVNRLEVPQLQGLRELVAADSGRPTTFGWGPRFLHSTGQYHRADRRRACSCRSWSAPRSISRSRIARSPSGSSSRPRPGGDAAVLAEHGRTGRHADDHRVLGRRARLFEAAQK